MLALGELLDHLRAEGVEVIRLTARNETTIDVDLLVHPVTTRVADVRLDAWPRRQRPPADDIRLDQRPGTVADCGDRLALLEEVPHERDSVVVGAENVRTGNAARKRQAVVVRGVDFADRVIDGELVAFVEVIERLDLARLGSYQVCPRAGALDRLEWPCELNLFDALVCRRGMRSSCPGDSRPWCFSSRRSFSG